MVEKFFEILGGVVVIFFVDLGGSRPRSLLGGVCTGFVKIRGGTYVRTDQACLWHLPLAFRYIYLELELIDLILRDRSIVWFISCMGFVRT